MRKKHINATIGQRIRALRKMAGFTQSQLAEAIGVTYQQVQKYENGSTAITIERLYQIAEALSISPLEFLPEMKDMQKVKEAGEFYGQQYEVLRLFEELKMPEIKQSILTLLRALVKGQR